MVCRDDHAEEEAKPAPISLRRAAAGIGFQAQDCLMVGDHMMDLECARAAGSGFIGVLSGSGDEHLWRREGVSMIVSDVGEIPKLLDVSRRD
jgi:phosphoglycolate phosphatase